MKSADQNDVQESRECRQVRRLLSDRLDAPLAAADTRRIDEHLAGCNGCRAFARRLDHAVHAVAALPGASANPRVREEVLRQTAGARSRVWLKQGLKLAGGIAAFALVGAVLVAVMRPSGGDNGQRAGSGAGNTPTAQVTTTPTPAGTPALAPAMPCVTIIDSEFAPAKTISSTPNGAVLWFHWTYDTARCEIPSAVTVTLRAMDGTPLAIEGNGLAVAAPQFTVNAYYASVMWLNWCGNPGPFYFDLGFGPETYTSSFNTAPGCDDPDQPSKLGPASPVEPTPAWGSGTPPSCDPSTLVTNIDTGSDGPDVARVITLKQTSDAGNCAFDGSYTVWLQNEDGTPVDIAGNGLQVRLAAMAADPASIVILTWANWCGDPGPFQISIDGPSSSSGAGPVIPPACADASQPSTLSLLAPNDIVPPTPTRVVVDQLPACPADQVSYLLDTEGEGGTRYIWIMVEGPGKVECVVDEHPTVTIVDANGAPLDITGNGLVAAINGPEPAVLEAWVGWSNWCGDAGTYQAIVSGDAGTSTISVDSPPCVDSNQPSQLQVTGSPNPPPAPTASVFEETFPPTLTPSPAAELPACAAGDYTLMLNAGSGLTGGQIGFELTALATSKPCRIDGGITFTLRDANGAPLDVQGNGMTVPLDAWPAGYVPLVGFVWSNWCGGNVAATAEVTTADGTTASMAVDPPPTCMSGSTDAAPSTLSVSVAVTSGT